jgi:RHS repeat-associated protein
VTDQNGKVHEHVEYFPYGEVWREPKSDRDGAGVKGQRFLFSGKELDEETGLYYFGARYYDPVRVRWASTDPLLGAYVPQGQGSGTTALPAGGVFNTVNLSSYHYASWSPLRYIDSDGRAWGEPSTWQNATDFVGGLALGFVEGSTLPLAPMEFGTEKYSQGRALGMKLGGVLDMFIGAVMAGGGVVTGPGEAVLAPAGAAVAAKGAASYAFAMSVKPSRPGRMQQEVERGQAPKDVKRVDPPHAEGEPHVHYDNGTSSNQSGTVHDKGNGQPSPPKGTREWLEKHGWTPPKKK